MIRSCTPNQEAQRGAFDVRLSVKDKSGFNHFGLGPSLCKNALLDLILAI